MEAARAPDPRRVAVLAANAGECSAITALFERSGVECVACRDVQDALAEIDGGCGALVATQAALDGAALVRLSAGLAAQPPWSDLPVILIATRSGGAHAVQEAVEKLGNVTVLEQPIRVATLRTAARTALRARRRQFEQRDRLEALHSSEATFRHLAETLPQLAWMAAPDGSIHWYNKRWYEFTGTTFEEMKGWGWTAVHDPAEVGRVLETFKAAIASATPWEDTFPLRRHDGVMRWHLSRAMPLRDAQGRVLLWFGTNTDITEQRQMQEALRASDRKKDEFLATLAHELRNPLAPIRNAISVLQNEPCDAATKSAMLGMLERQSHHLVRLVDDLLEISRFTLGKIELHRERTLLADVIRSAVETGRPLIDEKAHRLTVDVPDVPIELDADPMRLAQVLANLINNAAKYTDAGGAIEVRARLGAGHVDVTVQDDGVGIPREQLSKVFEMFTQIDRAHGRSEGGLGIGLTLVRSLVVLHGGTVEAHSDGPGTGSEFRVRLPIATPAGTRDNSKGPKRAAGPSAGATRGGRGRVLVVDDNRDAADSLALLLRREAVDVEVRRDGPSALQWMESWRPDLVLLDIGMPGMDGFEVARRVRARPELRGVRLVALTGWSQDEDRRRTRDAGFDRHVVKPVGREVLKELVEELSAARAEPFEG